MTSIVINITAQSDLTSGQPPPTESYIWKTILSPAFNTIQSLFKYLRDKLGVDVDSHGEGSLLITVTCSSLQILEGLWEDYSSGNLNKVAEQTLVTPEVLEKLGLNELKLKTTITEGEYNKCKEFFLSEHLVSGADNFICLMQNYVRKFIESSHHTFGGQLLNAFQTNTVTNKFWSKPLFKDCPPY